MPHITDDELLGWRETDQTQRDEIAKLRADAEWAVKRIADLEAALTALVDAKDEKEANGETARYLELRRDGWDRARKALGR